MSSLTIYISIVLGKERETKIVKLMVNVIIG